MNVIENKGAAFSDPEVGGNIIEKKDSYCLEGGMS